MYLKAESTTNKSPIPLQSATLYTDRCEPESQRKMDLETVSQKQANELEHLVKELLIAMRKAGLQTEPLVENLRLFEQELGDIRRKRFDEANPEYLTY